MPKFPVFIQHDANDCGPACLRMIAGYYGKHFSLETLREKCHISHSGVSLLGISEAAESIGFRTTGIRITYRQLCEDLQLPCIAHWSQEHFIVILRITKTHIHVADPAFGLIKYPIEEFVRNWTSDNHNNQPVGICLSIEPTPDFYKTDDEPIHHARLGFLFKYLHGYKSLVIQIILGIILGACLQVIFPFLFQSIVDKGIIIPNPSLIITILIAQAILIISRFSVEFIRNWIILHLGSRINIYLVSDFLIKLMRLPMAFFDSKNRGDLMQRVADHQRIETFLTYTVLRLFHSAFSIVVFSIVLALFSFKIFLVFLIGSICYLLWTLQFMKRRRDLDNRKFAQLSGNQSTLMQLFSGMQEIRLNNCEKKKRWEWENIQARLFRINLKGLTLMQKQKAGALFFNEFKDVLIIFYAAQLVLNGQITLGGMVAISYVVGQLSGPLEQMIDFFHTTQDAKISLERLSEVHSRKDEDEGKHNIITNTDRDGGLTIKDMSFQYEGPQSPFVLKNIDLYIPHKKITAIVGTSGSGKTTLLKLLLSFYSVSSGEIWVGNQNLKHMNASHWRSMCGAVMQDGYIFSDTIAQNIALSDEETDKEKLLFAARLANVIEITDNMPMGFNTKLGPEGLGLSQGQKQRILIARAIYKNPEYLFFDEATNALDANNEKVILDQLNEFFAGRTVIIVAHRLSTVKNADQLIVLSKGSIVETGTHAELTKKKGHYYNLVKNQLELGT